MLRGPAVAGRSNEVCCRRTSVGDLITQSQSQKLGYFPPYLQVLKEIYNKYRSW